MNTLTKEYASKFFKYDNLTGVISWKERPRNDFKTVVSYIAWNKKYIGKSIGTRIVGERNGKAYIRIRFKGRNYMAHRVAWLLHYGKLPENQIDHKDGNGTNNRIENLRDVTHLENCRNVRLMSHNTSGCSGVSFDKSKGKWRAAMYVENKKINIGTFENKSDAIIARKMAEHELGYHPNHGSIRPL